MAIEVTIPRLGWNMEEGVFLGWLKGDGQPVAAGEPLFNLEGDKATQEIESLESGVLRLAPDGPKEGETVAVGAVIAYLVSPGEVAPFRKKGQFRGAIAEAGRGDANRGISATTSRSRELEAANLPPRPAHRPGAGSRRPRSRRNRKERSHHRARHPRGPGPEDGQARCWDRRQRFCASIRCQGACGSGRRLSNAE